MLLLSCPGINVVSAAELAGELEPIANDAQTNRTTGRAGLYRSRYQSDQVDLQNGPLVRMCNRPRRAALLMIADNLLTCKLVKFHQAHATSADAVLRDLQQALAPLPKSSHADEAPPLAAQLENNRAARGGLKPLADVLPLLLASLEVGMLQSTSALQGTFNPQAPPPRLMSSSIWALNRW